jgi:hypothetical protein
MRILSLSLSLLCVIGIAAAQNTDAGKRQFENRCARCHGADATGGESGPRDPEFERTMVEVLHVYKEVEIVNEGLVQGCLKEPAVVTISYDEKPGIQALAVTTPDRPSALRIRVHAQGWVVAEHRRKFIQQDGTQHASRYPCRQQAGVD